jgi:hypothetical protein
MMVESEPEARELSSHEWRCNPSSLIGPGIAGYSLPEYFSRNFESHAHRS